MMIGEMRYFWKVHPESRLWLLLVGPLFLAALIFENILWWLWLRWK